MRELRVLDGLRRCLGAPRWNATLPQDAIPVLGGVRREDVGEDLAQRDAVLVGRRRRPRNRSSSSRSGAADRARKPGEQAGGCWRSP